MSKTIKETKEALAFVIAVIEIVAPELKDGFQPVKDLSVIVGKLSQPESIAKLEAAIQGAGDIPAEASDVGFGEGFELLALVLAAVKKLAA
jgi:hypothetical protein